MIRRLMALAVVLTGAVACQSGVAPTLKPVSAALSGGVSRDRLIGSHPVMVRTYSSASGKRVEVAGIPCTLRATEFSAAVVTPQIASLPMFLQGTRFANRGRPGPMTVTCKGVSVKVDSFPIGGSAAPNTTTSGTPGQAGYMQTTTGVFVGNSGARPWGYPAAVAVDLP